MARRLMARCLTRLSAFKVLLYASYQSYFKKKITLCLLRGGFRSKITVQEA